MARAIVRVRARVWVRVRVKLGDAMVRNAVGRKVGNPSILISEAMTSTKTLVVL